MKNNIIKKTLTTFFLLWAFNGMAQLPCPAPSTTPTGHPVVSGCVFSIDRYLARSITLYDMVANNSPTISSEWCQNIELAVKLKAFHLRRVGGSWGGEDQIVPGQTFYTHSQQAVTDINNAYDYAHLERPLIEAAILELITPSVNNVQIPQYVLQEFQNDPDFVGYSVGGTYNFDNTLIGYSVAPPAPWSGSTSTPDMNKLQTRMWYYYCAKQYLDMGYQCLHLGAIKQCLYNDQLLNKTANLIYRIRAYAAAQGKLVIIDAHTDKDLYDPNTHGVLLDFNSSPIRPDEVCNNASDYNYVNTPCFYDGISTFQKVPTNYNVELAYQKFTPDLTNSVGGSAPCGCNYDKTPTLYEWDWHFAFPTNSPMIATHNGWQPWAHSEAIWWGTIAPECRAYWIDNATCATKNDLMYRGYLNFPGRILNGASGHDYFAGNETLIMDQTMNKTWKPNKDIQYTIAPMCVKDNNCNVKTIYRCKVTNPDCSSVYQWHVQKPDGTWMDLTYGVERDLYDLQVGSSYKIFLDQQNLAMDGGAVLQLEKLLCVESMPCGFADEGGMRAPDNTVYTPAEYFSKDRAIAQQEEKVEQMKFGSKLSTKESKGLLPVRSFSVYPNPANDIIHVSFNLEKTRLIELVLMDMTGSQIMVLQDKTLFSTGTHTINKSVQILTPGDYMVQMRQDEKIFNQKLTIVK